MPDVVQIPLPEGFALTGDRWSGAAGAMTRGPVVLAHGGGQTRHSWGGTAEALAALGHEVLAVDLRGHGDSGWSPEGNYFFHHFALDAPTVAASMGGPVHWVGASLGGMAGLLASHTDPHAFRSLVLVDITPRPAAAGVQKILEFMDAHVETGFASLDEAADAVAAYQPQRRRPADPSGLAKNLRLRDGRWYWHWDPAFRSVRSGPSADTETGTTEGDQSDRYAALEEATIALGRHEPPLPTLLIRGRQSDVVTQEEVDHFRSLAPHARYVDIADAAHMIAGDKNDVFTDAVAAFVTELTSS